MSHLRRHYLQVALGYSVILCPLILIVRPVLAEKPVSRPKYGPAAVRLFDARQYLQRHAAPDFWALMPYYVSQPDDGSCSVASVAMLVNGLRAGRKLTASDQLATPDVLLDKVDARLWKDKVVPKGKGVTLDELAEIIRRVLVAYRVENVQVKVIRFAGKLEGEQRRLRDLLSSNEKSAHDLVLVNVLQSVLTGDPEGAVGHIAPLAAYDAAEGRVLLLDPDRKWYEPYWVPVETLLSAMATKDAETGRCRGLIHVSLEKRP